MKALDFLIKEDGAISVDWVVLSTAVAVMCVATAGVLTTATNKFSAYNARELAIQNKNGSHLFESGEYTPQNDALYDAYVAGLSGLSMEELDAIAAFANRLHAVGYGQDVGNATCNAGVGVGSGGGYCRNLANGVGNGNGNGNATGYGSNGANPAHGNEIANVGDFLLAIDQEYVSRDKGRPSHTHIDSLKVGAAFETMGLTQNEIRALVQG